MRLDPPLDPTSPEAREWLEDELRKGIYHEQRGLLAAALGLADRPARHHRQRGLPGLDRSDRPGRRGGRRRPRALAHAAGRALDDRRRAAPACSRGPPAPPPSTEPRPGPRSSDGDAETAVLEAYRALARSAVERTLLDDLPGRTAHEVAVALAPVFPASAASLALAADTFDAVRYGRRSRHGGVGPGRDRARRHPVDDPAGAPRPGHARWACDDHRHQPPPRRPRPRRRVAGTGTGCGAPGPTSPRSPSGLLVVVLLALTAQRPTAPLDPEGTGPDGARALAEVLRDQGVEVEVVRSIDDLEAAAAGCRHDRVRRRPHQPRRRRERPARCVGPARRPPRAARCRWRAAASCWGFPSRPSPAVGATSPRGATRTWPATNDVVSQWDTRYTADAGPRPRGRHAVLRGALARRTAR